MTGIDPDKEYDDVEMQKRIDNAYTKSQQNQPQENEE